jgi:hypothetical protein
MDWGRLIGAANAGDSLATDHLIDAFLKGELPEQEEQTFEESCVMYWVKDAPYSHEAKTNAMSHDSQESSINRDKNASCMHFRFTEAAHMSRLLGLGLQGFWEVSVTFHPHSHLKIRVHMVEEEPRAQPDLYAKTRAWQRAGFKIVREWKRLRIISVRQHFPSQPLQRPSLDARNVTYSILCASKTTTSEDAASGLRIDAALSTGEGDEQATNVFRVSASAIFTAANASAGKGVCHKGELNLYGGSFCSLADWQSKEDPNTEMRDSIDAHHGATTFRCTRSEAMQSATDISEMSIETVWLLHSTGMHTFRASVQHELEILKRPQGKLLSRVSRLFRDSTTAAVVSLSHSLSIYVTCDLSFADFLTKLGVMRRVRDQAIKPNQAIQRIGTSARF